MATRQDPGNSLAEKQVDIERARALIAEGASDLERGRLVDGDTFMEEWRRELAELASLSRDSN